MKKKFMSVMLAATLVVSLVGCGKKNNNNTATDADDTSNKAITAEEYNATIASNAAVYKKYITLPEYKGIAVSVDKSSLTVSDDDVETYISNILSSYATSEQEQKEQLQAVILYHLITAVSLTVLHFQANSNRCIIHNRFRQVHNRP